MSKPGHELQHRFVTAEPSPKQLEANAALAECLRLELGATVAVQTRGTSDSHLEIFDLPVEKMREGYYTDAYFNFALDAAS